MRVADRTAAFYQENESAEGDEQLVKREFTARISSWTFHCCHYEQSILTQAHIQSSISSLFFTLNIPFSLDVPQLLPPHAQNHMLLHPDALSALQGHLLQGIGSVPGQEDSRSNAHSVPFRSRVGLKTDFYDDDGKVKILLYLHT